jgi:hypothetical protein
MSTITAPNALNALEQCGFFRQSVAFESKTSGGLVSSQCTRRNTTYHLVGNHFKSAKLTMTETAGYSGLGEIEVNYKNKRVGHTQWAQDCADLKMRITEWAKSCEKKYKKDRRAHA